MSAAQSQDVEPSALGELVALTRQYELWSTLAWSDTKLRYRRTKLGPLWLTISTGVTVLMIGLVYGRIFGTPAGIGQAGYIAFFATGFILWTFISAVITEGCLVFTQATGLIKAVRVPLLLHIYRMIARNLVILAHNALIILILWPFIRWPLSWEALLVIPGFILLVLTLLGAVMVLSVVCTRFRDVQQIVAAILQLMFLLTPIIWPPESLSATRASFLLEINPVYYLLQVTRGPLLGEPVSLSAWAVAIGLTVVSLALGLYTYGRFRYRIAYWL